MMEILIKKISWYSFITMILVALIGGVIIFKPEPKVEQPIGSVGAGSVYQATTTYSGQPTLMYLKTGDGTVNSGAGTLGSIVITKAGAGTGLNYLYDATTTNSGLRAGAATSTIILAAWPGNLAAGTYTFDEGFYKGLILENNTGASVGSSTITFR